MKKSRKIVAGIMAVCLVFGVAVIPENIAPVVSMTESAATYGDFSYSLISDKTAVKITEYTGLDAEVVIPAEIDGLPVTYIGDGAFESNKGLASVVIPDSVNTIGWSAFSDCIALTSVTLPANLKKLDPYVFKDCKRLTEDIVLLEGITSMESGVFWGCSSLTSVSLPKYIKTVSAYSFVGCAELEIISFTDDLTAIEEYAFYGCAKLQNIVLPETLKIIGAYAFRGCESFTEFIMPDSVQTLGSEVLENCVNIETVKLSEKLEEIPYETFYKCESLKEIIISEKVKEIGIGVFVYCSSLEKITVLNPECKLSEYGFVGGTKEKTVIYGYSGSTAQAFAEKYGYTFVALGGETTDTPSDVMYGDSNGDGTVSIADAVIIMQTLSSSDTYNLSEQQDINADVVDGNGITTMDALAIQAAEAKLITIDDFPTTSEKLNSIMQ